MKVVILAGGYDTRLTEETGVKPKPMVEIGPLPILWHIMKIYSHYGLNDFIICLGYRGEVIINYFKDCYLRSTDVTFNLEHNTMEISRNHIDPWRVTLVQTGLNTMTGGRLHAPQTHLCPAAGVRCFFPAAPLRRCTRRAPAQPVKSQ